ncbi:MAG: DUF805 domain-containing protein [Sphingomonadales bacterium]|nr:MAG: DUF805 domain-containing protein [Sphingomonadales bacterium]
MEYMILPFKRYFDFTGRSRRMEYWMFTLLNVLVIAVLSILAFGTGGAAGMLDPNADPSAAMGALFGGMGLLLLAWALVVLIPGIAVTIRRLHDRDMSGWWYLGFIVASFIPFVGFVASIALLVLMFLPGTEGPNRFGEDPKNPVSASVFE